jgi:DNA-binding response OmpR family regulator
MAPPSVLLVEDEDAIRGALEAALRAAGFAVRTIPLAAELFDALQRGTPDVIVLDLGMPQRSLQGMEALTLLRRIDVWRTIPVIILSAFGDIVNRDITQRLGVADVITKPLDADVLIACVQRVAADKPSPSHLRLRKLGL